MSRWPAKASGCPRVAGKSLSKSQVQSACVGVDPQVTRNYFWLIPFVSETSESSVVSTETLYLPAPFILHQQHTSQ